MHLLGFVCTMQDANSRWHCLELAQRQRDPSHWLLTKEKNKGNLNHLLNAVGVDFDCHMQSALLHDHVTPKDNPHNAKTAGIRSVQTLGVIRSLCPCTKQSDPKIQSLERIEARYLKKITVTSLCNDCCASQEKVSYNRLSLLRGATAVRMHLLVSNCICLTLRTYVH